MYSVRHSNKPTFRKVALLRPAKLPGATGGKKPKRDNSGGRVLAPKILGPMWELPNLPVVTLCFSEYSITAGAQSKCATVGPTNGTQT
jgi:hypothetical protein